MNGYEGGVNGYTTAPGNLTGVVNFDGVDDYVELANSRDINRTLAKVATRSAVADSTAN